jgi:hypothetical protein
VELENKLGFRKLSFESEKYKALGRGAPFGEKQKIRLMKARPILETCLRMSREMGLLEASGRLQLSSKGKEIVSLTKSQEVHKLGQLMLDSYQGFGDFLRSLQKLPRSEVSLPDIRHTLRPELYKELSERFGIKLDGLDFMRARDILGRLGLSNWYREKKGGETWSTVYLTCNSSKKNDITVTDFRLNDQEGDLFLGILDPGLETFHPVIWEEYLRKTNYVQWRPLFYSDLRTFTCMRLRICDAIFDQYVGKMIGGEGPIQVIWSSGTLPKINDSSNLFKNLPPKDENSNYMVYLKLGKK